jgi:serine/threonine-protein kinase
MKTLDDIKPGKTIGRYEFLVPIARGGMAAVWACRLKGSRGFSKIVAVKTMLPSLSDDPAFEQMFLDEAQIAAQIRHPNVAEIMDLGEEEDVLYIVMEYVDGESLATILRAVGKDKARMPLAIALRLMTDACHGLHAAHELRNVEGKHMGLVHRDISPQNILLSFDGVAKLVDFGVAKAAGRTSSETTAGQIKGKAPYMSPEQALGQPVDRRTDLFAMGIVLFQVSTGKHPFRGESDVATLHNILHRSVPSPRFVDDKFPRPLEAVINKALQRDPSKRYQTAADMASALERVFPPTVRQAGVADVGQYVQGLLGEVGATRREALREAIKHADLRATSPGAAGSGPHFTDLADIAARLSAPSSDGQGRMLSAQTEPMAAVDVPAALSRSSFASGDFRPASQSVVTSTSAATVTALSPPDLAPASAAALPVAGAAEPLAPEPVRSRRLAGLVIAAAGLVIALAIVGVAAVRGARARTARAASTGPSTAGAVSAPVRAPDSVAVVASHGPTADAVASSAPVYDIESVSRPVGHEGSGADGPRTGAGAREREGKGSDAGKDAGAPAASATAPAWKPPPVSDPGF